MGRPRKALHISGSEKLCTADKKFCFILQIGKYEQALNWSKKHGNVKSISKLEGGGRILACCWECTYKCTNIKTNKSCLLAAWLRLYNYEMKFNTCNFCRLAVLLVKGNMYWWTIPPRSHILWKIQQYHWNEGNIYAITEKALKCKSSGEGLHNRTNNTVTAIINHWWVTHVHSSLLYSITIRHNSALTNKVGN